MIYKTTNLSSLCRQIVEADISVRFSGIANKFGRKVVSEYRRGLVPLLTESELELSAIESVIRMNTRRGWRGGEDLKPTLGKPIYSFTLYENIKRVTFLLDSEDYPILMVSLDKQITDQEFMEIMNKILSIVKKR
jgi:hypothetical protein